MQERPQNFEGTGADPEATLVAPRFDAEEARRAHPVVPLVETDTRAPFVNAHAPTRRGLRRSWPTALFAVMMLAAAAAGGALATRVFHRPQASAPVQTEAVPAQTEAAPAPSTAAEASRPSARNEAGQAQEAPSASQAPPPEEARVKQTHRAHRESREREGDAGMLAAPAAILRRAAEDSDDKDERRRGREREGRRERDDDAEAEKEIRKALKHAKGKAPRLVDVLTGP